MFKLLLRCSSLLGSCRQAGRGEAALPHRVSIYKATIGEKKSKKYSPHFFPFLIFCTILLLHWHIVYAAFFLLVKGFALGFKSPSHGRSQQSQLPAEIMFSLTCILQTWSGTWTSTVTFIFLVSLTVAKVSKVRLCLQLHTYCSTEFVLPPQIIQGKPQWG